MVSKKILGFVAIAAVSLAMVGCGGKTKDYGDLKDAAGVYPKEIQKLLDKEYKESISAVGQATSNDQITALKKARLDATTQIAAQFQQEVASLQKRFLEEINDTQTEHFQQTEEVFVLTTLHGDKVIKEMTAKGKDGYTAYVLRALDVAALKTLLDAQKNAEAIKAANIAYRELEERVAREKAARAAANQ